MRHARHTLSLAALGLLTGLGLSSLTACGGGGDNTNPAAPLPANITISSLRLIDNEILPRRGTFQDTVLGGFSGIDYDRASRRYTLITDDRLTTDSPNPPRMYTLAMDFTTTAVTRLEFLSVFAMKQPNGQNYPKVPDLATADPEGVRIDPTSGNLLWVSEGERTLASGSTAERIIQPFVREIRPDGTHVRQYSLPSQFTMSSGGTGPRNNAVFEGIAITPSNSTVAVIMEGALQQDALPPTTTTGSFSRIALFDRATGQPKAQYVYPIDRVQAEPSPAGSFTVNGPTEILALSETRFLVLERSFSVGVVGNQVRLYEINTEAATDVSSIAALGGVTLFPVTKRLVLNFESIKAQTGGIANLEGMTFGPVLGNNRLSLVVVADDNFPTADSATDRNQILVFEVQP